MTAVTIDAGTTPDLPWREKAAHLWQHARPHRRVLVIGVGLGLLATAADLATPLVTKGILDGLATAAPIGPAVALLGVLLVVGSVVGLLQAILLGRLAERIILSARTAMVTRLFRVRVPELDLRAPGEMVARVTSDTVLIREATTSSVTNFVNGAVGLVGALVLMGVLDLVLLASTIGVLVVVAALSLSLMPRLARYQQQTQEAVGQIGGRLEGALRALRTVKASRAEARETDEVLAHARTAARLGSKAVEVEAVSWTIVGTGMNLAVMLVLGIGAWRVGTGALEVSALVAFLLYVFQLMLPTMLLSMGVTSLQSGLAAAARIAEVDGMAVEVAEPPAPTPPAPEDAVAGVDAVALAAPAGQDDPVLRLRDVVLRYPGAPQPALDGVSIDIARRGHTAIVGPSGAGKTTAFSLLLRFLEPERGSVTLDGRPFATWSLHELRRRIAYVEQDTPLVPGSLRRNLIYAAPGVEESALWAALRTVRLEERVSALPEGLDTELAATTVSGGERQRIAVARALVARPRILLLDEATAQMDGLTEAAVARGIAELARHGAVVTIAHRLSTVIEADRIILLEAGRVRATGTHDELLATDELYQDLVAALRIGTTAVGVR